MKADTIPYCAYFSCQQKGAPSIVSKKYLVSSIQKVFVEWLNQW